MERSIGCYICENHLNTYCQNSKFDVMSIFNYVMSIQILNLFMSILRIIVETSVNSPSAPQGIWKPIISLLLHFIQLLRNYIQNNRKTILTYEKRTIRKEKRNNNIRFWLIDLRVSSRKLAILGGNRICRTLRRIVGGRNRFVCRFTLFVQSSCEISGNKREWLHHWILPISSTKFAVDGLLKRTLTVPHNKWVLVVIRSCTLEGL